MRSVIRALTAVATAGVLLATVGQGTSRAAPPSAGFAAQSRAAGLSAEQAAGLQAKVDGYLASLAGRGTQVSPNQIAVSGAVLSVTVPGEDGPRQLVAASHAEYRVAVCHPGGAAYGWFCAFERENFTGDHVAMYNCLDYFIPWYTTGSWDNNQTPGTRPLLYFSNGTWWYMPGAPSRQRSGVDWSPVAYIVPC